MLTIALNLNVGLCRPEAKTAVSATLHRIAVSATKQMVAVSAIQRDLLLYRHAFELMTRGQAVELCEANVVRLNLTSDSYMRPTQGLAS